MHLGQFSCGCLGLTLAAAVACGGGGDPNAADHDMNAMGGHEMTAPTEATPVDGTILGGGTATEVHPGDAGSPHVNTDTMYVLYIRSFSRCDSREYRQMCRIRPKAEAAIAIRIST